VKRLLLVAFFLEVGFALIVVPWSSFWDQNYFAHLVPPLEAFMANNFVRGAVSGLGLINLSAGMAELVSMVVARGADRPASISPSQLAEDR
jgi:hypothetical protein